MHGFPVAVFSSSVSYCPVMFAYGWHQHVCVSKQRLVAVFKVTKSLVDNDECGKLIHPKAELGVESIGSVLVVNHS